MDRGEKWALFSLLSALGFWVRFHLKKGAQSENILENLCIIEVSIKMYVHSDVVPYKAPPPNADFSLCLQRCPPRGDVLA